MISAVCIDFVAASNPALQLARQRLLNNEKVVQGLDMAWKEMALDPGAPRLIRGSGPGCVPVM